MRKTQQRGKKEQQGGRYCDQERNRIFSPFLQDQARLVRKAAYC